MKAWWNLTQEGQVKRSFKCAIGCVLIAVLFICLAVHSGNKSRELQRRCTAVTTGEVISVFPSSRYRFQSSLTADYIVNGVKYNTEGVYSHGEFWGGDTLSRKPVPVHYDPASPSVAYAAERPRSDWKYMFIVLAFLSLKCLIDTHCNIWRLLIQRNKYAACIGIKSILCSGIAYLPYRIAYDFRNIHIALRRDFTHNMHLACGNKCFACYTTHRILFKYSIKYAIRNLIRHFVWMPFGYRFRRE